jgi:hypothetical protein
MDVLPSAAGSTGSGEPVDELARGVRATGAGAPSPCPKRLSLSGAAFDRKRR